MPRERKALAHEISEEARTSLKNGPDAVQGLFWKKILLHSAYFRRIWVRLNSKVVH